MDANFSTPAPAPIPAPENMVKSSSSDEPSAPVSVQVPAPAPGQGGQVNLTLALQTGSPVSSSNVTALQNALARLIGRNISELLTPILENLFKHQKTCDPCKSQMSSGRSVYVT